MRIWMLAAAGVIGLGLLMAFARFHSAPKAEATNQGGADVLVPIPVESARTAESKAKAEAMRAALVGKPMTIAGKTLEGGQFSTEQWKGKVVVVDFWASWCPDCLAELPKVIQWYQTYHPQGLELVGVSSDVKAEDFSQYLKQHPEIAWTELYTPPLSDGRHPLNTTYGVDWIPTLFIIDKNGICRSVKGSEEMEKLVPVLLAEKAQK